MPNADVRSQLNAALVDRYVVDREIGQGGMATVYIADDLRHNRKVALKVLRPELAAVIGADRFLAEIKTTAGLQHPHILPLHDSGEANGTVFYVMPFVEGESLRDRLNHEKQLPIDEALRIAREVAGALDYAHRHGVVHRDIKPENILLHDGQALVADFGIALAVSRADGGSRMTETGMSLGTPHYMAPEQAMGEREITPKADTYALGCVLYELLTGDPPFTGSTAQAIVARTITEQPRGMVHQRRTIPPHVEAAVLKALEKLPADRFATAGEFSAALGDASFAGTRAHAIPSGRPERQWKSRLAIPMTIIAGLALAALAWLAVKPSAPVPVTRFQLAFPPEQAPLPGRAMVVSSDGAHLVYVGPGDSGARLWVKARDHDRATPLAGTAGVGTFTISTDGQWIAFTQRNSLKKIPLGGGSAITLADSVMPMRGVAWLDDHSIVFVLLGGTGLRRVAEVGGAPTELWHSDTVTAWYPAALPGSRGVLFDHCRADGCSLWALDLKSHAEHQIEPGVQRAEYVPTGHILLVRRDGAMLAEAFNPRTLVSLGAAAPVVDSIALGTNALPLMTVSGDGTLYARIGPSMAALATYELVWVDRTGAEVAIDSAFQFHMPVFGSNTGWSLSGDGTRLAIGLNTGAGDQVWVKQLPHGPLMRTSFDSVQNFRPRWMRDGRTVMFISRRGLNAMLYKRAADGTGVEELVYRTGPPGVYEGQWSPDGSALVLRAGGTINTAGGRDIMVVRPGVDSTLKPLLASPQYDESGIALSPDGKWIAYESNETSRTEVFIRPFPAVDTGRWQVSGNGGRSPLWARNGRELFFVDGGRNMSVVSIASGAGSTPLASAPKTLFHLRDELYLADQENYTPHDIAPDGQHFIMARRLKSSAAQVAPLIVTENWFQELRQRVAKK